jgi:HD-GYP domain-containing protein (c-di-GMP phosphodiesterase class II)
VEYNQALGKHNRHDIGPVTFADTLMKKKINVNQAKLGMYVDSLCGSWIDHPFWRKSFPLVSQKELEDLLACGTQEIWINTELGDDADPLVETVKAIPVAVTISAETEKAEQEPPVILTDEIKRARKIHTQGRIDVTNMFKSTCTTEGLRLDRALILVDEIRRSTARNQNAFLSLTRSKNKEDYLCLHSIATCALMIMLGRKMEMDYETIISLGLAGLLLDIGNIGFPDDLPNKPGQLTRAEYDIVKSHPMRGWKILQGHNLDNIVLDVCLHHHERMNGKGYPEGMPPDSISQFAKMAAVCDTYDSLISDSYYRRGMSPANAIREMTRIQEVQFDKAVFHAFIKTVGIYPFGTLVKLKSGRVAVVEEQSKKSLASPIVRVFFSTRVDEPIFQEWVDLSKVQDAIVSVEDADELSQELRIDLRMMSII